MGSFNPRLSLVTEATGYRDGRPVLFEFQSTPQSGDRGDVALALLAGVLEGFQSTPQSGDRGDSRLAREGQGQGGFNPRLSLVTEATEVPF